MELNLYKIAKMKATVNSLKASYPGIEREAHDPDFLYDSECCKSYKSDLEFWEGFRERFERFFSEYLKEMHL